jgi:hypothetical protein
MKIILNKNFASEAIDEKVKIEYNLSKEDVDKMKRIQKLINKEGFWSVCLPIGTVEILNESDELFGWEWDNFSTYVTDFYFYLIFSDVRGNELITNTFKIDDLI